jgi:hypothetical protein
VTAQDRSGPSSSPPAAVQTETVTEAAAEEAVAAVPTEAVPETWSPRS